MRKTFWTSDTHFNQERTFKYSMRGLYFSDLNDMNWQMVSRWNDVVSEGDTVYHLGDFGDFEYLKYLNGNIILLEGNYERDGISYPTPAQKDLLCDYVKEEYIIDKMNNLVMTHEPSHIEQISASTFYLFGHIHEKQKVKNGVYETCEREGTGNIKYHKYGLNVGVDCHNFAPVSIETINFYRKAIVDVYDRECFKQF